MAKQSFWDLIFKPNSVRLAEEDTEDQKVRVVHLVPSGSTGTDITGGVINEEYLQDLIGPDAADIYDKMRRSDPKVKMCLMAVSNPIKSGKWSVEASDDSEDAKLKAEFIEYCLFNGMNKRWKNLLSEILTMIPFGYSLFERTHRVVFNHEKFGNFICLKNMAFRSQRTIENWNIDCEEHLESVTQYAFGDAQETNVDIPAKFLNLFTIEREGSNFEGISMLRPVYGPWFRKNTYLKLQAIGIEKFAVPTPVLKVPEGKQNSAEFSNAVSVLEKYVSHQANYMTLPEGWEILFNDSKFDASKVQASIDAENREIVNAFMANFLELGQSGSGSYALSFDLSDFFLGGIEYLADIITEEFNSVIIPELINLNYGPQEQYPKLRVSGISDRIGKEFGDLLKALSDSRYITPDDGLEKHLRSLLNLPEASDEGQRPAPEKTGSVALSEKKKEITLAETPRGLITRSSDEMRKFMRDNLTKIGLDLVSQIIAKHKKLNDSQKLDAVKGNKPKGSQAYKKDLKNLMAQISTEALVNARKEVPKKQNVRLAEFERLPKSQRDLITLQSQLIVDSQMADLEKATYFQLSQSDQDTKDSAIIEKDLKDSLDSYVSGSSVSAAAGNSVGRIVNSARQAFFYDDEVLEEIEAFKFTNPSPDSPICKDLNGRIFAKDDPESDRFRPPLHHNCKSYVVPILKSAKRKVSIDPRGLKPSDPKLEKSITLEEK